MVRHSPRDAETAPLFGRLMHHMAMAVKPILGMVPPDPASLARAYEACERIRFERAHYRKDIAARALKR